MRFSLLCLPARLRHVLLMRLQSILCSIIDDVKALGYTKSSAAVEDPITLIKIKDGLW